MSAAVVAQPGETIADRLINAAPCDIGIYVGAGVSHVTIRSVTVQGANFQGILAEKTSYVTIEHSTITDNAFGTVDPSAPPLPGSGVRSQVGQAFAISLFGVSHSTVAHNTVYNNGRGGIGVMDNGPNDPGTITQNTSAPLVSSSDDSVIDNQEWANYNGCGIVAATQNLGGSLSDLVIAGNTITGTQSSFSQIG
ncbi:MAG TPA: right-handed parallel beta-helix repeat-containing protein, partial [Solirubrobacteraceae bacterium]|nr:right-handed parallel beta-helix repeat-containing protein [Solirubrobacteraceae bacterium]